MNNNLDPNTVDDSSDVSRKSSPGLMFNLVYWILSFTGNIFKMINFVFLNVFNKENYLNLWSSVKCFKESL